MAVRKFVPSLHPRDRFGRFTRSRSAEATPAERRQAADVAKALKPKRGVTRDKASAYLSTVGGDRNEAVAAYTSGGHEQTHKALRAGKTDDASVKAMDAAMAGLPDDLVVSRRVPLSAFGGNDPADLEGFKVRDAAYAPTALGAVRATKSDVRMRIAVPKGTRAAVDPETGEVILDRDLDMVVAKVEPNSVGGVDMWLTVLPKAAVKPGNGDDGKPSVADTEPDQTDEQLRGELMKLRVPELRELMETRQLKPVGRMRKSAMVDAILADESGEQSKPAKGDSAPAPAETTEAPAPATPGAAADTRPDITGINVDAVTRRLRDGETAPEAATLDAAMSPLEQDERMLVRVPLDYFGDVDSKDLVGKSTTDAGFLFGTRNAGQSQDWRERSGSLIVTVDVPAGTPAWVDGRDMILGRGQKIEVTSVDKLDYETQHRVYGKVVPAAAGRRDDAGGVQDETPAAPAIQPARSNTAQPSPAWVSARTDQQAFAAAPPAGQVIAEMQIARKIRQRDWRGLEQAVTGYTQDPRDGTLNYVTMNTAVRSQGGGIDPKAPAKVKAAVENLDKLLTGAPLRADTITYRGIQSPTRAIPGWSDDGDNVGLEWTAEGYQSTTTDPGVARDFAEGLMPGGERSATPTVARVLLPKGAPGLRLSPLVGEILTARNQRFRLVRDYGTVEGVRRVDIELVPEAPSV